LRVGRTFRNPETGRYTPRGRNLQHFDGCSQSFGYFKPTLFAGLDKQHGKLFATDARRQIDAACAFAQNLAETTDGIVASIMTETVVEVLKAVDVDHQEAESMTVSFHAGHLALELSFKASTVCETSQMVRKSRFFTRVEVGFELEQCPGPCKQQIEIGRVSDITQSAGFIGPAEIFASSARRGLHDHGNKLRDRVGPDSLGQLVPVHARHHDVG